MLPIQQCWGGMRVFLVVVVSLLLGSTWTGGLVNADGLSAGLNRILLSENVTRVSESEKDSLHTIVSGATSGNIVILEFGEVQLTESLAPSASDVTIIGKSGDQKPIIKCPEDGPAVLVKLKGVKLIDVQIQGCSSTAVRVTPFQNSKESTVVINQVNFLDNGNLNNDLGGAIRLDPMSYATISNCNFSGNRARRGGAIYVENSEVTIQNSTFSGNSAMSNGGAIYDIDKTSLRKGPKGLLEVSSELTLEVSFSRFANNTVTTGMEDRTGLLNVLGAPLEDSQFLLLMHSGTSGGGLYVTGLGLVSVRNCAFVANKAPAGGAIFLGNNLNALIGEVGFEDNTVRNESEDIDTPEGSFKDLQARFNEKGMHGGALYSAATAPGTLSISQSSFKRNVGMYGGGVHVVGPKFMKLTMKSVSFEGNRGVNGGGGLVIRNLLNVQLSRVGFSNNSGHSGGGLLITNGAEAIIGPTAHFQGNSGVEGGGIMCFGAGDVLLDGVSIVDNFAQLNGGGGSFVASIATSPVALQDVSFVSNTAMKGGGAYFDEVSEIDIRRTAAFKSNKALSGGAIMVIMGSRIRNEVLFSRAEFVGNVAGEEVCQGAESGRIACDKLRDDSSSCGKGGGAAVCLMLNDLPSQAPASVLFQRVSFADNVASNGGALHVLTAGSGWRQSCPLEISRPRRNPCRTVQLINPFFSSGITTDTIFASDTSVVYLSQGTPTVGVQAFVRLDWFLG
ncbi:hypothetical protein BSKO_03014 [Bryopsis sp. KO-2023]|nr:hypothetical protein BSKO_03014 [Bryopsis sp. KO-2023]